MFLSQVAVFQPFNPAFQFRARFLHPRDGPIKPMLDVSGNTAHVVSQRRKVRHHSARSAFHSMERLVVGSGHGVGPPREAREKRRPGDDDRSRGAEQFSRPNGHVHRQQDQIGCLPHDGWQGEDREEDGHGFHVSHPTSRAARPAPRVANTMSPMSPGFHGYGARHGCSTVPTSSRKAERKATQAIGPHQAPPDRPRPQSRTRTAPYSTSPPTAWVNGWFSLHQGAPPSHQSRDGSPIMAGAPWSALRAARLASRPPSDPRGVPRVRSTGWHRERSRRASVPPPQEAPQRQRQRET